MSTGIVHEEQKAVCPEAVGAEHPATNGAEDASNDEAVACGEEPFVVVSGLSSRAGAVRNHLQSKRKVTAVILRADGSSEEIRSDLSSQQIRALLSGRVTIVGEIEDLRTLVIRSSESGSTEKNQHQLPVPLCHGSFRGDFLLYRMDENGNPTDLKLDEFQKYVEDHKTLTETAIKNFSTDSVQIKSHSPFGTAIKDAKLALIGAIDAQIRSADDGKTKSNASICKAVEAEMQRLVDAAVSQWSASPMEDPDYEPVAECAATAETDDVDDDDDSAPVAVQELDDRSWRDQLNDALHHVRRIGKIDGQVFAQRLSATFYELNGERPSVRQLSEVLDKIRTEFEIEAEEELGAETEGAPPAALGDIAEERTESEDDEESPEGSEAEEVDVADEEDLSPLETLKMATRTIGNDWVSRAQSLYRHQKGREPTESELAATVKQLAQDFADSVLGIASNDRTNDENDDGDEEDLDDTAVADEAEHSEQEEAAAAADDDEDYDPDNADDAKRAEADATESRHHDQRHFGDILLMTPFVASKAGGGTSWRVFFDESELTEMVEAANLEDAVAFFRSINQREPSAAELHRMKLFLSVPNGVVDDAPTAIDRAENAESRSPSAPSKVLVTPIKEKKNAKKFNVYLEDSTLSAEDTEQLAIKWFQRFNKREPSEEDLAKIRTFVQTDSDLTEQVYLVPDGKGDTVDDDEKNDDTPPAPTTKRAVTKKAATGYTLDFEEETQRKHGDEKMATKWFKRFNNRDPDDEELAQIKHFVLADGRAADEEEMVDID